MAASVTGSRFPNPENHHTEESGTKSLQRSSMNRIGHTHPSYAAALLSTLYEALIFYLEKDDLI